MISLYSFSSFIYLFNLILGTCTDHYYARATIFSLLPSELNKFNPKTQTKVQFQSQNKLEINTMKNASKSKSKAYLLWENSECFKKWKLD